MNNEQLYSTPLKLFEDTNIVVVRDFGDGRSRYEIFSNEHHDHLIDTESGEVIEFVNDEIEELQHKVAKKLGYVLTGHRLELYGKKKYTILKKYIFINLKFCSRIKIINIYSSKNYKKFFSGF